MSQWAGQQPIRRGPAQADDLWDDEAYLATPPVLARARYTPLAQREAAPPPQPVFVVDQRRGRWNRQPQAAPGSPQPHRRRPAPPLQARLPQPRVRQTQDDPEYQPQSRRHQPVPMQDETWDHEDIPRRREGQGPRHRPRPWHWVLYLGLGMLAMLALWYLVLTLLSWWRVSQDDLHYGRPRTFQCDAVVGHHDSTERPSHFIALNLNRQVEIIEFPGGDPAKAKIYLGPPLVGPGQDLAPVTLTFRDVNGDGKPDMLVDIEGSEVVFINDGGAFRPLKPGELVHL